ncbi:hypothetical protein [Shewanella sp. GD03713]|uniref:hypothetical protein n=1 Tax=Shewanella sp. GD03713 TaxID=2975372 RepID=UPI002449B65A|nr:hypothetical protein [Shewanella sp. GD03713]MDH1468676.1 hypothetical protein [Shewanella sp. GD03713]
MSPDEYLYRGLSRKPMNEKLSYLIALKRKNIRDSRHEKDNRGLLELVEGQDSGLTHNPPKTFPENQLFHAKRLNRESREVREEAKASGNFYPIVEEIFSPETVLKRNEVFTQMIDNMEFLTSSSNGGVKRFLVYRSLGYLEGELPKWVKLDKLYKHCLMTLAMREQCKRFYSFTLNLGKELNESITPDNQKQRVDELAKRIQKNVESQNYTNFRIWFSLEYSLTGDIGYHLHGFVGWDEGSKDKLSRILSKAADEWVVKKNKQCQFKNECVFWKESIIQTFYALKTPVHVYSSHPVKQGAKKHYEKFLDALNKSKPLIAL